MDYEVVNTYVLKNGSKAYDIRGTGPDMEGITRTLTTIPKVRDVFRGTSPKTGEEVIVVRCKIGEIGFKVNYKTLALLDFFQSLKEVA